MDYLDFELRFSPRHDAGYEVVVVRSVKGGEPKTTLRVPLGDFDFMQPLLLMASHATSSNDPG